MGTVNILECIRKSKGVKSFLNITTDKVYFNNEWEWGYRECDPLDGYDPYSNSKSCSELVTHAYKNSFFLVHQQMLQFQRLVLEMLLAVAILLRIELFLIVLEQH